MQTKGSGGAGDWEGGIRDGGGRELAQVMAPVLQRLHQYKIVVQTMTVVSLSTVTSPTATLCQMIPTLNMCIPSPVLHQLEQDRTLIAK